MEREGKGIRNEKKPEEGLVCVCGRAPGRRMDMTHEPLSACVYQMRWRTPTIPTTLTSPIVGGGVRWEGCTPITPRVGAGV